MIAIKTDGAIEADLMERLSLTLQGAIDKYGYHALWAFVRHVVKDVDSYSWRALNPQYEGFDTTLKTNVILADVFDAITGVAYLYQRCHSRQGALIKAPEPYPRTWRNDTKRHFGAGAIPISDFEKWYYGGDL